MPEDSACAKPCAVIISLHEFIEDYQDPGLCGLHTARVEARLRQVKLVQHFSGRSVEPVPDVLELAGKGCSNRPYGMLQATPVHVERVRVFTRLCDPCWAQERQHWVNVIEIQLHTTEPIQYLKTCQNVEAKEVRLVQVCPCDIR